MRIFAICFAFVSLFATLANAQESSDFALFTALPENERAALLPAQQYDLRKHEFLASAGTVRALSVNIDAFRSKDSVVTIERGGGKKPLRIRSHGIRQPHADHWYLQEWTGELLDSTSKRGRLVKLAIHAMAIDDKGVRKLPDQNRPLVLQAVEQDNAVVPAESWERRHEQIYYTARGKLLIPSEQTAMYFSPLPNAPVGTIKSYEVSDTEFAERFPNFARSRDMDGNPIDLAPEKQAAANDFLSQKEAFDAALKRELGLARQ